jgi:hypothetical protein
MRHQNFTPPKTITFFPQFPAMACSTTLILKAHDSQKHHHTPNKAKIQEVIEFCEKNEYSLLQRGRFSNVQCVSSHEVQNS